MTWLAFIYAYDISVVLAKNNFNLTYIYTMYTDRQWKVPVTYFLEF